MLHAICHLGSSNLRLAVEPKRQIELLLLLRRYLLWLTMLMAFVHALCTRIGPPWQLQHTWIGVRSCAASTSFAMAARSCCTGATLLRFNIFPRTLTGYLSCQVSSRWCGSQRVWPRTALAGQAASFVHSRRWDNLPSSVVPNMRSHKIGVMLAKAAQSVPRACIMHRHFGLSVADAIPPIA